MGWCAHRHAPAPGTILCPESSVDNGTCRELRFGEGDDVLSLFLHRRGAQIRAYVNSCPHFSLPLNARSGNFLLLADSRLMCAWHCAVFELDHGLCLEGPAKGMSLEPVAVQVSDGFVRVAAP
jgi:nitrite reductase/ring-hydroxylating ferredoxin subunit